MLISEAVPAVPAVALAALLSFLVLYAIFLSLEILARPVVALFRHLPLGIGGPVADAVQSAINWIGKGLESLIRENLHAAVWLFAGLRSIFFDVSDWILAQANNTAEAIEYLAKVQLHRLITLALAPALTRIAALEARLKAALLDEAADVSRLGTRIGVELGSLERALQHRGIDYFDQVGRDATAIAQGLDAALGRALQGSIDVAGAKAGAALRGIDDLTGRIPFGAIGTLTRDFPLLAATVATVVAEAGLDSAACRAKFKQVCGVDPGNWAELLTGIALLEFGFHLEEFVREMAELVEPVTREIYELVS